MTLFNVFFSNRTEQLYECLKKRLFTSTHPLARRLVIVPSAAMKTWLLLRMAKDPELGISAGIEIGFLEPTIQRLDRMLAKSNTDDADSFTEPNEMELALALEKAMHEIIIDFKKYSTDQQKICLPLLTYLGTDPQKNEYFRKRCLKRITALSLVLAKLFQDYGRYGGGMVAEWKEEHWQQLLWQKMEDTFAVWNYPYRKLESFKINDEWQPEELQIHLFGLSYLSPLHHHFFEKISKQLPVSYYIFSPCEQFWSDMLSNKESTRLMEHCKEKNIPLAQQTTLDDFLKDNNPLLANFGRLGREMALQIESSDPIIHEEYCSLYSVMEHHQYTEKASSDLSLHKSQKPLSLLEALQTDILLLRNPTTTEKIAFDQYDGTIQIHAAPKPMREVQVVYDTILSIIEKHQRDADPISPGDIVVMAPNIMEYAPFVRTVFGATDSCLEMHLMDVHTPSQQPLIKDFLQLISLPQGRWEISQLVTLLESTAFRTHHHLSAEDVKLLTRWIKEAGVRWGNDSKHRNELLKRDHSDKNMVEECWHGTWEHGLGRLLEGLALLAPSKKMESFDSPFSPLDEVESTQAELLGSFLNIFHSLMSDLKPLVDQTELSLSDWSMYLKCLLEAYFACTEKEKENYYLLQEKIEAIGLCDGRLKEQKFHFHSIQQHLKLSLETHSSSHKESNLQAVKFCSLLPMRAVPAKVIILMGMGDGKFPRTNNPLSLNQLLNCPKTDYYPTQVDFDRYLFLESMLSARRYFILTYTSQSPGDSSLQLPSPLIKELLNYIEEAFTLPSVNISQKCVFDHPLKPFHKMYFSENSAFKSYSQKNYLAAKIHYQTPKKPQNGFLSAFAPLPTTEQENRDTKINLMELTTFAKNPLKYYFNKTLNIFLENSDKNNLKNDEELLIASYDKNALLKDALISCPVSVFADAERSGRLPRGPFKEMEMTQLHHQLKEIQSNLNQHSINSGGLFSIEFSEHCQTPMTSGRLWNLPKLTLEHHLGSVDIVGRIEMVSSEGLIVFDEDKLEDAIKIWPTLLVLGCLIKKHSLPIRLQAIFIKENKIGCKPIDFDCPEVLLKDYLAYYFKAKSCLTPLLPTWISPTLQGNQFKLQELFEYDPKDIFRPIYDEYHKWLSRNSPNVDMGQSLANWQQTAQSLFVNLNSAWYSPKTKGDKEIINDLV